MSLRNSTFRIALLGVWTLALGLRAWHGWSIHSTVYWDTLLGDAARYHAWASEIAEGKWLGEGTFYQAPLYPYLLGALYSLTGPSLAAARALHSLLGATSCVLLASAGRSFFGPAAGLLAGLLLALSPAAIFHDGLLQKASLATFLVCGSLALLGRLLRKPSRAGWLSLGLTVGALGLVRENALLIGVPLAAWACWFPRVHAAGRPLGRAALMAAGALAALAPAVVHNRIAGGEWALTTAQFGPNFYIGNNRDADGLYTELLPERGIPKYEQADATAIAEERAGRSLRPQEVSAWWTRQTWEEIQEAPGRWLQLLAQKTALTWSNVEIADTEDMFSYAEHSPPLRALMACLPFSILAGLGAFGLAVTWRFRRRIWILYALLATYTASVALFYVFARYRLPLVPVLAMLAGGGILRGVGLVRRRRWGRLAGSVAATVLVWGATQPAPMQSIFPRWPDLSPELMQSATAFNVGAARWNTGAPEREVEDWFQRSVTLYPGYASAWLYWGRSLVEFGRVDEAIPKLHRAASLDPEGADIRIDLGEALLLDRKPAAALEPLTEAVEIDPSSVDGHHLLGRALAILGRREEAIPHLEAAVQGDPAFIPPRRLLAVTLDRIGRHSEARMHFRELSSLLPSDSPERAAIRRILERPLPQPGEMRPDPQERR